MKYVYKKTEPTLWTVGFYNPANEWVAETEWNSANEAAQRVSYLNGNTFPNVQLERSLRLTDKSLTSAIDRIETLEQKYTKLASMFDEMMNVQEHWQKREENILKAIEQLFSGYMHTNKKVLSQEQLVLKLSSEVSKLKKPGA